MRARNLLVLAFRVISLVFGVAAAVVAVVSIAFVLRSEQVPGTVVDHARVQNSISFMSSSEQTGILHYPVVSYEWPDGEERQITGPRGRSEPQYEVGDRVEVYVSTSNPEEARIATVMGVWGTAIVLAGIALIFLLISLAAPLGFGGVRRQ